MLTAKNMRWYAAYCCLIISSLSISVSFGQTDSTTRLSNYVIIAKGESADGILHLAANVVPSKRQWGWQRLEFIGFIHFGMNTFLTQEWGNGTADPSSFNPTAFDARQWVDVARMVGMKMLILTTKHHDGFCLWPSKYTKYSVKNSPWRHGKGDVVKEVAEACRNGGLKFGVYLSPWDRHDPSYGDSPKYNEHFRNQLRELLSNYGEISEVWFDGANGEGPNGKKQVYDWPSYYKLIRDLQPNAVIAIMGPDVRWVGTESGYARETEWSVLPVAAINVDSIASHSQQVPLDAAFVPGDRIAEDLGSRAQLKNTRALAWYPAETDVSIRSRWFYRMDEDSRVKTPENLVDIYYSSVGRNSMLLLNVPPDKRGLISSSDIASLTGMRAILDQTFAANLLARARATASNERHGHRAKSMLDSSPDTYWTTDEGIDSATIRFDVSAPITFDRAMLQEYVREGQRIERFHLDAWDGASWTTFASGTTVGYKRLLRFPPLKASSVRLIIERSRTNPTLSAFGLFASPPVVHATPDGASFEDSLVVHLSTEPEGVQVRYTLDGSLPTLHSTLYASSIVLKESAHLKAIPILRGKAGANYLEARFTKCFPVQSISIEQPVSPKYYAKGPSTLIDGIRGVPDDLTNSWLGFEGHDMTAILDLGQTRIVHDVAIGCLLRQESWIFTPLRMRVAVSLDGITWKEVFDESHPLKQSEDVLAKDILAHLQPEVARYIRVIAANPRKCPPWHVGAGSKAWIFIDEIVVR